MDAAKKNQTVVTGCIIGWMLLSAILPRIAALAPILMADTLLEGSIACLDQTVVFTCRTTGSLAWRSDEYIGRGGNQVPFGVDNREGTRHTIDVDTYAELLSIDNGIITSTFHIKANSSSIVNCTATDHNQSYSVIDMRILDKPGIPEDPVAIQIRDMRYERCFIPVMWKNTANSVEARVANYTININQFSMYNQMANLSSTAYYSLVLATECAESHTVDISATNICGMTGLSTVYRTQRQGQECPTDTDTSSCVVTEVPTMLLPTTEIIRPTRRGYSEQNRGNILVIIVSGTIVTTYLLSSFLNDN